MTDTTTVRRAIYDHLIAMPGAPTIVFSNTSGSGSPRIEVESFGNTGKPLLYDGTQENEGRVQVTVVVPEGTGETLHAPIVSAIMTHFANNTVVGPARIDGIPEEKQGYPDNGEWRVPVILHWQAFF